MAEEKKKCPKCGNECGEFDIFCNKCGEKLPQKPPECPICGEEYKIEEDLYCRKCGAKLEGSTTKDNSEYKQNEAEEEIPGIKIHDDYNDKPEKSKQPSMIGLLIGVFCIVLFGSMFLLNIFTPDSSVKIPRNIADEGYLEERNAKPCDDKDITERLKEEFKENYPYYEDIASSSINRISVKTPVTIEFESSNNRYLCTATIILDSSNGLRPREYEAGNKFYNLVQTDILSNAGAKQIKNAMKIKCDVKYSSEIIAGRETVKSSACGGGTSWSNGDEEIIWDRYKEYVEIPGEQERLQKEKEEENKKLEEERLAEEQKVREEEELKAQEALKKQMEAEKKAKEDELKRLEAERKRLEEEQKKHEAISKETDEVFKTIMPAHNEERAE